MKNIGTKKIARIVPDLSLIHICALLFLDVAQAEFSSNSGYWCDIAIVKYLLVQTRDQIKEEYGKVATLV